MELQDPTRLLTAADLAALPRELPSGPVHYELWKGVLTVIAPPGHIHGRVESRFAVLFDRYGEQPGHGEGSSGEAGILLHRDPDTVFGADAYFHTSEQLPVRLSPEGWVETIPAIVTEIRSKNDTNPKVADKVADYLAAGVHVVVVADPRRKRVSVHRVGQAAVELGITDTLSIEDVIPGFLVPVTELFRGVP